MTYSSHDEFRMQVRAWLTKYAPGEMPCVRSPGGLAAAKAWEAQLAEAGYSVIGWPRDYGGLDASPAVSAVFDEEYTAAQAPHRLNVVGLHLMGPTTIEWGSTAQKERWLPGIRAGQELWCQGFSEPEAGSDLANVQARAERSGDAWIVSGQKTWTTDADLSDWMFALVRTDPQQQRHRGLTFATFRMDQDGVDVRPIRQLTGSRGFSEVFLEDVVVPDDQVLGPPGEGWQVAMSMLQHERGTGVGSYARLERTLARLRQIVVASTGADDPEVLTRFADVVARTTAIRAYTSESILRQERGVPAAHEASILKLALSELEVDILQLGVECLGMTAFAQGYAHGPDENPQPGQGAHHVNGDWLAEFWYARASCIFAGSNEIQRNIIAERVLGLPKGPR